MSIASEINRIRTEVNAQESLISQIKTALDGKGSGAKLPSLTNEGAAGDLVIGKELIDSRGNIVTGTNPYAKAETDTTVNEQANLIRQISTTLAHKATPPRVNIYNANENPIVRGTINLFTGKNDETVNVNGRFYRTEGYIGVLPYMAYKITAVGAGEVYVFQYDSTQTMISYSEITEDKLGGYVFVTSDNCCYIRMSFNNNNIKNLLVELIGG